MRLITTLLIALLFTLPGCDDPAVNETPDPIDVGRPMPDVGDAGAISLNCAALCDMITNECPTWSSGCDRCNRVNQEVLPGLSERTSLLCDEARASESCVGLRACLGDKHGVVAGASGANVTIEGLSTPVDTMGTAWAIVGAKSDGSPSDLEIYTEAMGQTVRIKFDDIILGGVGVLSAEDFPIEVELGDEETKFKIGTVGVIRLNADGEEPGFELDARVRIEGGDSDVRILVSGPL